MHKTTQLLLLSNNLSFYPLSHLLIFPWGPSVGPLRFTQPYKLEIFVPSPGSLALKMAPGWTRRSTPLFHWGW